MNKSQKIMWLVVTVLATTFITLLATRVDTGELLSNNQFEIVDISNLECDLATNNCNLHLPDQSLWNLNLSPKPLKALHPLQLTFKPNNSQSQVSVNGKNQSIDTVQVEIIGLSMDMGINRFRLARSEKGAFEGEIRLPVCSTDMLWEMSLLITTKNAQKWKLPLRFKTIQ